MVEALEIAEGRYGSFAIRSETQRHFWSCFESSDYHYMAVTDDFGNLVQVGSATNLRGY
jgi:hypothetical protein